MSMTLTEPSLLEQLEENRDRLLKRWEDEIKAREAERTAFERGNPTPTEIARFHADEERFGRQAEKRETEIKALDERIKLQGKLQKRRAKASQAVSRISVYSEPLTYYRDAEYSYWRDLAAATVPEVARQLRSTDVDTAGERLLRHAREMDVEMPRRAAAREARALRQIEQAESDFRRTLPAESRRALDKMDWNPFERRINPNRLTGEGGYFVPPLWLDEYIKGLRPGRVTADRCRRMDLPMGTDSINLPKLSTLTLTGIQGADNAPVASQDFTDTSVTANIKTLAGQEDVALQLIDQSPYHLDEVLTTDLLADYDKQLDLQVISGSGANASSLNGGSVQGLYSSGGQSLWTGYNSVTYTSGAPAPWHLFSVFGAMQSKIAYNRFLTGPSLTFVLHPRRAMWYASGVDGNNRPLVESRDFGPFNVAAIESDSVPAEGQVARVPWGPAVFNDGNMPTTDAAGGGSNQDIALAAVFDDCWLFEGELRTRALPEVLSGTLQLRLQVYNYVAFLVRYGQSLAIASGSGFVAPTGAVSSITF
jgi:HK97 family phage major capsid protein